jgi:hypothetical protein
MPSEHKHADQRAQPSLRPNPWRRTVNDERMTAKPTDSEIAVTSQMVSALSGAATGSRSASMTCRKQPERLSTRNVPQLTATAGDSS